MRFLPERLKAARKLKGMTQEQLAEAAGPGVTRDDVVNAEAGRVKSPRYLFMIGVSKALEKDPAYFFDSIDVKEHYPTSPDPAA